MTDHAGCSEERWDDDGDRQKFPILRVAAIVIGAVVVLTLLLRTTQDRKRGAREENIHYSGYKRSNYPGMQGSHDGVQNGFNVANGLFGKCTNTRIRDISDGTSNTVMVAERDLSLNHGAIWMRSVNHDGTAEDARAVVGVCFSKHRLNSFSDPHAFSSMHEGGAHFLLGDGSVRFVQENIALDIYVHLAQRNDGEVVPEF